MPINQQANQMQGIHFKDGLLSLVLKILLVITVFCIFLPLLPVLPSAEPLDPSWTIGINQAVAQGLRFGKDVIFTFGPYAAIYNKAFHPATEHLELIGSLYLAALYAFALIGVFKRANIAILIGIWLLLAGFTTTYDCLFFSYGLLVATYCWKMQSNTLSETRGTSIFRLAVISLLFTGFGLYPLIKGTLFAFYGAIACLTMLFYAWHRQWIYLVIIPLSIISSMGIFWIYSGQNLQDLPSYYQSISSIISGYTDAMSIDGNRWEIIGYALTASLLTLCILYAGGCTINNLYLFLIFSLFLFINFKAGFVRHDQHSLMCGVAIVFATLLATHLKPSKIVWSLLILAIGVLILTEGAHKEQALPSAAKQIISTYSSSWNGALLRLQNHDKLVSVYEEKLKELHAIEPLPALSGKSDIYPFDQIYLLASKNTWGPRPVLQSYSAYNKPLAEIDSEFLNSQKSADNIFFRVATIDGRYPSSDDGNSWPILLMKYHPSSTAGSYLILQKNQGGVLVPELPILNSATYALNTWVELPNTEQKLFASIDIQPSLLGKLKNIVFKSSHLGIAVRLADGSTKYFRLVAGNVSTNFLLSPLIESTEQFSFLYKDSILLHKNRVEAISIWVEGSSRDWQNSYQLTLKTLN